jgi:hypothetical protein
MNCEICTATFDSREALDEHLREAHAEPSGFEEQSAKSTELGADAERVPPSG